MGMVVSPFADNAAAAPISLLSLLAFMSIILYVVKFILYFDIQIILCVKVCSSCVKINGSTRNLL
mgnify:CR=1 FL=1